MAEREELADFIRDYFRSVWALDLLLLMKGEPDRFWRTDELVQSLRASESVVTTGLAQLFAGGLIVLEEESARFGPAGPDLAALVEETEALYAKKPDAIRRLIVSATGRGPSAFADSFRLRKD